MLPTNTHVLLTTHSLLEMYLTWFTLFSDKLNTWAVLLCLLLVAGLVVVSSASGNASPLKNMRDHSLMARPHKVFGTVVGVVVAGGMAVAMLSEKASSDETVTSVTWCCAMLALGVSKPVSVASVAGHWHDTAKADDGSWVRMHVMFTTLATSALLMLPRTATTAVIALVSLVSLVVGAHMLYKIARDYKSPLSMAAASDLIHGSFDSITQGELASLEQQRRDVAPMVMADVRSRMAWVWITAPLLLSFRAVRDAPGPRVAFWVGVFLLFAQLFYSTFGSRDGSWRAYWEAFKMNTFKTMNTAEAYNHFEYDTFVLTCVAVLAGLVLVMSEPLLRVFVPFSLEKTPDEPVQWFYVLSFLLFTAAFGGLIFGPGMRGQSRAIQLFHRVEQDQLELMFERKEITSSVYAEKSSLVDLKRTALSNACKALFWMLWPAVDMTLFFILKLYVHMVNFPTPVPPFPYACVMLLTLLWATYEGRQREEGTRFFDRFHSLFYQIDTE